MTLRVAVIDDYQRVAADCADWARLEERASVTFLHDHLPQGPELVDRLRPFHVLCAMRERTAFPRELLEQLPNLRLLLTSGNHNAAIDLQAAREVGIVVSGTDSHGKTASELTVALVLALARNLVDEVNAMRAGGWQVGLGRSLHGATLGLVGFGRVAHQVATVANAFGMRVLAHTLNPDPREAAAHGVELVDSLDELLGTADFTSLHVRLTPQTRGLIGANELARMPADAYLINTSRGPVVDEAALIDALERGIIAGAAIDVYEQEPLPADHPIRSTPRLLTTPHIGYVIREAYDVYYRQMVEAIEDFLEGRELREITGD
jgi:phosphoglycerate dehydrogenase-like enzyme